MLTAQQVQDITALLDVRLGLDALWVYGSAVRGELGPESDVDLAALFGRRPAPEDLVELTVDLEGIVGRLVDLVDLDRASPILVMQVLRTGVLLVDADRRHRLRLETAAPSRYEDLMIVRRPIERALIERVRHGRA